MSSGVTEQARKRMSAAEHASKASIGEQIIEQKFSHCFFSETCVGPANNRVYQSGAAFDINNAVVANIGACERKCEMTAFCKGMNNLF